MLTHHCVETVMKSAGDRDRLDGLKRARNQISPLPDGWMHAGMHAWMQLEGVCLLQPSRKSRILSSWEQCVSGVPACSLGTPGPSAAGDKVTVLKVSLTKAVKNQALPRASRAHQHLPLELNILSSYQTGWPLPVI